MSCANGKYCYYEQFPNKKHLISHHEVVFNNDNDDVCIYGINPCEVIVLCNKCSEGLWNCNVCGKRMCGDTDYGFDETCSRCVYSVIEDSMREHGVRILIKTKEIPSVNKIFDSFFKRVEYDTGNLIDIDNLDDELRAVLKPDKYVFIIDFINRIIEDSVIKKAKQKQRIKF